MLSPATNTAATVGHESGSIGHNDFSPPRPGPHVSVAQCVIVRPVDVSDPEAGGRVEVWRPQLGLLLDGYRWRILPPIVLAGDTVNARILGHFGAGSFAVAYRITIAVNLPCLARSQPGPRISSQAALKSDRWSAVPRRR
jgi:hypothetical protein